MYLYTAGLSEIFRVYLLSDGYLAKYTVCVYASTRSRCMKLWFGSLSGESKIHFTAFHGFPSAVVELWSVYSGLQLCGFYSQCLWNLLGHLLWLLTLTLHPRNTVHLMVSWFGWLTCTFGVGLSDWWNSLHCVVWSFVLLISEPRTTVNVIRCHVPHSSLQLSTKSVYGRTVIRIRFNWNRRGKEISRADIIHI